MQSPTIAFLVNGEPAGAMGIRARSFEQRLRGDFRIEIAYREGNKALAIWRFFLFLVRLRPALCYVFDMGFSGVIAASLYRPISRCRVVVDTGDAIYELARLTGRGRIGLWLTKLLEQLSFSISDRIVVRSHPHQELLDREGISADVIPDGVDTTEFFPCVENELRKQYGLDGVLVVGILGSLIWNSREQTCYGWELIELIHRVRDQPVKGVIIGDGSGLPKLKALCAAQNLEDRMVFLGRIPYSDLPGYLNMMDICLSTQTNDGAGQVRTTGKLPLYLACGRFVLSSQVGEAARLLPQEMLVPYDGTKDNEYPAKLEERVRWALQQREPVSPSARSVTLAQANFEYNVLAARLRKTLLDLLPARPERPRQESLAARESDPVRAADRE